VSRSPTAEVDPPAQDLPELVAELREVLLAAGYTGDGLRTALGVPGEALSGSVDVPLHLRRLGAAGPLGTLVALLTLEAPVDVAAAERAFAPLTLERVEELGLVARAGGEVTALVRIAPHDELLVASDRRTGGGDARADHVAGVHGPSLTLSHLTVRRPVETTLDVGTGGGIQAILAACHSGRVVGTDLNARALAFATFNAQLNGVENVKFRPGSFFEPVAGERFGLVTCNPPYVISPESEYLFRDSGMTGDGVSRHVLEHLPEHLEEGAFATALVSWVADPGGDWSEPLRAWLEGSGCDAWLLHHGTDDALTHAGNWLRHEVGGDRDAYDAAIERWLDYCRRLGIDGIAVGAVVLRRRSGENWVRADELPSDRLGPASDHILRVFAGQDHLAGLARERDLLDSRLALADAALLEQRAVLRDGGWNLDELTVSLEDGLGFRASLDSVTAAMLTTLDGEKTLRAVATELARSEDADPGSVEDAVLPAAGGMLGAGFLVVGR
jgi:methylase of polypeptide subunit release factors